MTSNNSHLLASSSIGQKSKVWFSEAHNAQDTKSLHLKSLQKKPLLGWFSLLQNTYDYMTISQWFYQLSKSTCILIISSFSSKLAINLLYPIIFFKARQRSIIFYSSHTSHSFISSPRMWSQWFDNIHLKSLLCPVTSEYQNPCIQNIRDYPRYTYQDESYPRIMYTNGVCRIINGQNPWLFLSNAWYFHVSFIQ